jgi:hypothetical protein
MKKVLKILGITLGTIIGVLILLSLLAGPIAKSYIEKHSKEICHRVVKIDKLNLNLFRGVLKIKGFQMLEENEKEEFLTFDELKINISLMKLLAKEVKLTEVKLVKPDADIIQNGDRFNFTDILDHFSSDEAEPQEKKNSNWTVLLRKISLENGHFAYKDAVKDSYVGMKDLSLAIPELYFGGKNSDADVHFEFENGGDFTLKMGYDLQAGKYKMDLKICNLGLEILKPYLWDMVKISDFAGNLTTTLKVEGSIEHILDLTVMGSLQLDKLTAKGMKNEHVASVEQILVDVNNIDLKKNLYHLNNMTISGLNVDYLVEPEYSTLALFSDTTPNDTIENSYDDNQVAQSTDVEVELDTNIVVEPSQLTKANLIIERFEVKSSTITYTDRTLKQEFALPIRNINIVSSQFALNKKSSVQLSAIVGEGGILEALWHGKVSDFSTQDITLNIKDLRMGDFSPYCVHFTAHPILDGLLNFKSENSIVENMLQSNNYLQMYNCKVDKKIKDLEPEFKIPLRAALYVLTDRKGRVDIELPVEGNIASPQFSFKKAIMKVLTNFLIKVVTSPINFIVNATEENQSIFANMELPMETTEFSAADYAKLNNIMEFMKEKEQMNLNVAVVLDEQSIVQNSTDSLQMVEQLMAAEQEKFIMLTHYFESQGVGTDRIMKISNEGVKPKKGKVIFDFGLTVSEEVE